MSDSTPALFRHYPALAERIPHVPLGQWPTPLEHVTLRSSGEKRAILVKRDDMSALPYGGNKVRKLEFLLAEAERRGAKRLITAGAAGSHHALATAVYGRARGFAVTLVLFPQPHTPHVRDVLLLDRALGAELRFTRRMEGVPFAVMRASRAHRRERPFVVAPGGSDALGVLGYASAALEILEQIDAAGHEPSRVHIAAGTLGTAAGLALGFALAGRTFPIAATRITRRLVANMRGMKRLIAAGARTLRDAGIPVPDPALAASLVELRHGAIGEGYGRDTEEGRAATRVFAEAGLELDITYTAKAAADLLRERTHPDRPPLFLHTLGSLRALTDVPRVDPADLPMPFRRFLSA